MTKYMNHDTGGESFVRKVSSRFKSSIELKDFSVPYSLDQHYDFNVPPNHSSSFASLSALNSSKFSDKDSS